jgi:hypothetical protein
LGFPHCDGHKQQKAQTGKASGRPRPHDEKDTVWAGLGSRGKNESNEGGGRERIKRKRWEGEHVHNIVNKPLAIRTQARRKKFGNTVKKQKKKKGKKDENKFSPIL